MLDRQRDDAYQQGYNEVYSRGQENINQEMQLKIQESTGKAEEIILAASQQASVMLINAESQLIDLALEIARKVVMHKVEEEPEFILPIVKAALEKVRNQEKVNIRVNQADYETVLKIMPELIKSAKTDSVINVTVDNTIAAGGCIVKKIYGSVDARLDSRFEMLKKALQDVVA